MKDPLKTLAKRRIQWIVFPSKDGFSYFLAHTDDWKVVYSDNVAEVFERVKPLAAPAGGTVAEARRVP